MILAIDPGLHGAMALYDPFKQSVTTYDMPTFQIAVGRAVKTQVDLRRLQTMFNTFELLATNVILEEPHAMPKQGVTSAFTFGHVCGVLQMASTALGIPLTLVRPSVWKGYLKLTADKDECRKRASQLFPAAAHQWALKKQDGRAEAALLAYYLWQRSAGR